MSQNKNQDKYLSLSGELDELCYGSSAADKGVAGLKLVGKGLFNATKFAFSEVLPAAIGAQDKALGKHRN